MALVWFSFLVALGVGGFCLGARAGRAGRSRAIAAMMLAIGLIGLWAWLLHNPSVAVLVIPVSVLSYLEGAGAVPMFMVVVGVAWSLAQLPHQKRLTILAAFFGGVFFLQGSVWMLQTSPSQVMGDGSDTGVFVRQTFDFSCVPAACATALNRLNITTNEAEMAELTQTKAGTGSTLIRAFDGLEHRLDGTPYRPQLVEPAYDELSLLSMPLLTPLRFETQRLHMVVIFRLNGDVITIGDPQSGLIRMNRDEFEQVYTGSVIQIIKR